jgi:hypothetical protein
VGELSYGRVHPILLPSISIMAIINNRIRVQEVDFITNLRAFLKSRH